MSFKWCEKACYAAANVMEVDQYSVRGLKPRIEREEPKWVERVNDEWPARRGDVESVAYVAQVPLQATMALLENLYERGELKTDDD